MNFFSGGGPGTGNGALIDQTPAITSYFSSMRLPATFMATQSINTIFNIENPTSSTETAERVLIKINQFLVMLSFMTSITSVVSGTAAGVKIIHGGFDPLAETPYDLLVRDFEFEYLSVRWSFLTSIFCFLIGMTTKSIVQFNLLASENRKQLLLFVSFSATVATYLLSYVNDNIFDYGSMLGMTLNFVKLIFARIHRAEPLVIMFVVFGVVTLALVCNTILQSVPSLFRTEILGSSFSSTDRKEVQNRLDDIISKHSGKGKRKKVKPKFGTLGIIYDDPRTGAVQL